MEIKIQLQPNLIPDEVIGTLVSDVSDDNSEVIVGEVIYYDTITGIAICELYKKDGE